MLWSEVVKQKIIDASIRTGFAVAQLIIMLTLIILSATLIGTNIIPMIMISYGHAIGLTTSANILDMISIWIMPCAFIILIMLVIYLWLVYKIHLLLNKFIKNIKTKILTIIVKK